MVEYRKLNVKLLDTQLKKLKTAIKDKTGAILMKNLKMLDGNDLSHEMLLTTRQKTILTNSFNNNVSTDLKLSRPQISKIIKSRGFLGSLLSKLAGPLIKITGPLAKDILAPLGAIDAGIQKKTHGSETVILIISNEEINDIMKTVQAFEDTVGYFRC